MWHPSRKTIKIFLFLVVFPIAFLWDLLYICIVTLYDVSTKIDDVGGRFLERLMNDEP
jgi:hypothetical protein